MMNSILGSKLSVLPILMGLILCLTLPACTCGAPPAAQPPSAQPPAAQPPAGKLSFEATEYKNAEYGFSVKYPKNWTGKSPVTGPTVVLGASSPAQVPAIVIDVVAGDTFKDALTSAIQGSGGSAIKIFSENAMTLLDGTPATEAEGAFSAQGVPFPVEAFWLGAKKGDKWVIVHVVTVGALAEFKKDFFSEIAHTLTFK